VLLSVQAGAGPDVCGSIAQEHPGSIVLGLCVLFGIISVSSKTNTGRLFRRVS
jgi:hypothetical protein